MVHSMCFQKLKCLCYGFMILEVKELHVVVYCVVNVKIRANVIVENVWKHQRFVTLKVLGNFLLQD